MLDPRIAVKAACGAERPKLEQVCQECNCKVELCVHHTANLVVNPLTNNKYILDLLVTSHLRQPGYLSHSE